jgi:hypothetical protein
MQSWFMSVQYRSSSSREIAAASSKKITIALLPLLPISSGGWTRLARIALSHITSIIVDNGIDCLLEYLVNAYHLLAAALHIAGTHFLGNSAPLFGCDWSEALCFQ